MDVWPHHLSILATSEPHATLSHPVRARQVQLQSVRPGAQLKLFGDQLKINYLELSSKGYLELFAAQLKRILIGARLKRNDLELN